MPVHADKNGSGLKCVWMSAGLINYKLCDLNFNCEHCEFHHAMQGIEHASPIHQREHSDQFVPRISDNTTQMVNTCLNKLMEGCKIHLDRLYYSSHFWLKCEDADHIQIGIDILSLKILFPLDRCILPQPGEHLQKGQLMGWLVRKERMIPLYSPIKGEITTVNPNYPLNASCDSSMDDIYLLKIYGKDLSLDLQRQNDLPEKIENFQQKIACLKIYLLRSLSHHQSENIGPTLGDGGTMEQNLENIMGTKLFEEFIHELFSRK